MKNPTSFDVAKLAGVSQTSVSRVYNEKWRGKISEATTQKVLWAAEQLGYSKNEIAKGLSVRRTGIVGIIKSKEFNLFYDQVISQLVDHFSTQGYNVMLFNSEVSSDINEVLRSATSFQLDGIVITSASLKNTISSQWIERDVPIVLINANSENVHCNRVCSDNSGGARQFAEFLHENGFRRYAYVSSSRSIYQNHKERQDGFLSTLAGFSDVESVQVVHGDYTYQSGLHAADLLLCSPNRPEVILCANEPMAMGVIDAARSRYNLRVPEDLSVGGFEDSAAASQIGYSLTALQQQPELLAENAATLLLRSIHGEQEDVELICVPQKLVVRKSIRLKKSR